MPFLQSLFLYFVRTDHDSWDFIKKSGCLTIKQPMSYKLRGYRGYCKPSNVDIIFGSRYKMWTKYLVVVIKP